MSLLQPDVAAYNATMSSCGQRNKWLEALHCLCLGSSKGAALGLLAPRFLDQTGGDSTMRWLPWTIDSKLDPIKTFSACLELLEVLQWLSGFQQLVAKLGGRGSDSQKTRNFPNHIGTDFLYKFWFTSISVRYGMLHRRVSALA